MASDPRGLLGYIEGTPISITRETFEGRLRTYSPAADSLSLLEDAHIEWLFRETSRYLKEREGTAAMRNARVPQDLEQCEQLMRMEGSFRQWVHLLEQTARRVRRPFSVAYAREVLECPAQSINLEEINERWRERLRHERFVMSALEPTHLRQGFTRQVRIYLETLLREATVNGRRLGTRTQQRHVNALVAAVMAAAGELTSDIPHQDIDRMRKQLCDERRASGLFVGDDEVPE